MERSAGNRAGSIFASSLQNVDEAVDDDTYDDDQGGFVTDTAGVFCAVISEQHNSDLYIDKSDLMPDLTSDDDTDSEDDLSLDQGMRKLSIVPDNLHTFDSEQFSYEAVSAELDCYLDGPKLCIPQIHHAGETPATHKTPTCFSNSFPLDNKDESTAISWSTS